MPIENLPRKRLSLRHNFSWVFFGNLVYVASQGGMLVVLAKLCNPTMVGQFALALAICTPVFLFSNFSLRDVLASDSEGRFHFKDYVAHRSISVVLSVIFIFVITYFVNFEPEAKPVIIFMCLAKAVESISNIIHGQFQSKERMDIIGVSMAIKGLLSFILLSIVIYYTKNLALSVLAVGSSWLVILLFYDIRKLTNFDDISTGLSYVPVYKKIINLTIYVLPLSVSAVLTPLISNFTSYLIEYFYDSKLLGLYAALAYPIVAGNVVVGALMQTFLPRLSIYWKTNQRKDFSILLFKGTIIGLVVGAMGVLIAIFFGRFILELLYKPEYAEFIDVFVWLMVAASLGYAGWFLNGGLIASGVFSAQAYVQLIVFTLVIIISWPLILRFNILGAAWVACISMGARVVLLIFVWWRTFRLNYIC